MIHAGWEGIWAYTIRLADLIKATGAGSSSRCPASRKGDMLRRQRLRELRGGLKKMQVERLIGAKAAGRYHADLRPKCLIHYNCVLTAEKKPEEIKDIDVKVKDASISSRSLKKDIILAKDFHRAFLLHSLDATMSSCSI